MFSMDGRNDNVWRWWNRKEGNQLANERHGTLKSALYNWFHISCIQGWNRSMEMLFGNIWSINTTHHQYFYLLLCQKYHICEKRLKNVSWALFSQRHEHNKCFIENDANGQRDDRKRKKKRKIYDFDCGNIEARSIKRHLRIKVWDRMKSLQSR